MKYREKNNLDHRTRSATHIQSLYCPILPQTNSKKLLSHGRKQLLLLQSELIRSKQSGIGKAQLHCEVTFLFREYVFTTTKTRFPNHDKTLL
jgi:hypothetical protein